MDTRTLDRFARAARRTLIEQVTAQLDRVRSMEGAARATHATAIDALDKAIKAEGRAALIERVAYTWFNRFSALRYMDANHLLTPAVVSPAAGESQPEILQQAKQGVVESALAADTRARIVDLLSGRIASSDPQQEAYRLLLVAACNALHTAMPFLFEAIDDYSELLLPADLLSGGSILAELRKALSDDACQDVEVIGWLYQFYIAEKKEEVDAKVKAGGKVEADELPAKTSLYTPDWIVRYLVENSLGRLWLRNKPHSRLAEQMAYYIAPGIFLKSAAAAR